MISFPTVLPFLPSENFKFPVILHHKQRKLHKYLSPFIGSFNTIPSNRSLFFFTEHKSFPNKRFFFLYKIVFFFCFLLLLNYEIRYCFALRASCRVLSQVRLPLPGILRWFHSSMLRIPLSPSKSVWTISLVVWPSTKWSAKCPMEATETFLPLALRDLESSLLCLVPNVSLEISTLRLATPPPSLSVSTHLFSLSVALATSYSFNRTLVHKVAEYTADEVRGKHNDYVKRTASSSLSIPLEGIYKVHAGITCWTPVVNIFRHPLWGRGQETYFSSLNLWSL